MKTILTRICVLCVICGCLSSCATVQKDAGTLAAVSVREVTKHNDTSSPSGELAQAGLYAAADVLQGYIDKTPPREIIANSPGIKGVGPAVVNYVVSKGYVKQSTVDAIYEAASIAAMITAPKPHTAQDGP